MEDRAILVPGVSGPALWLVKVGVLGELADVVVVVVVEVLVVVLSFCGSRRF